MAQVFTISGFGLPTAEQFEQLEAKNYAVTAHQAALAKIPPAKLLQYAIIALGNMVGNSTLSKLSPDGKIGPKTTAATNYVFATYLNAPNKMSAAYIQQHINYLQQQVKQYVEAHGGVVNIPSPRVRPLPTILPPSAAALTQMAQQSAVGEKIAGDNKWIWYVVGGMGVLLGLAVVAKVIRGRPAPRATEAHSQ